MGINQLSSEQLLRKYLKSINKLKINNENKIENSIPGIKFPSNLRPMSVYKIDLTKKIKLCIVIYTSLRVLGKETDVNRVFLPHKQLNIRYTSVQFTLLQSN